MNRKTALIVLLSAMILIPAASCMALPFLGLGALLVDGWVTRSVEATIVDQRWTRTIAIERWDRVERTTSCRTMPADAELLSRQRNPPSLGSLPRRHRHRTHDASLFCTYRLVDWDADEPAVASGTADQPRFWPVAPSPDACAVPTIGCRRGSTRTEAALFDLAPDSGEPLVCAVSEAAWSAHRVGERIPVPLSAVLGRPLCERIE